MSAIGLTLKLLRRGGYVAAVVESWVPHTQPPRRRDLLGFADVFACHPTRKAVLLVQVTTLTCLAARITKVRSVPATAAVLRAGISVEVWGWGKTAAGRWKVRRVEVTLPDLDREPVAALVEGPRRRTRRPRQATFFD